MPNDEAPDDRIYLVIDDERYVVGWGTLEEAKQFVAHRLEQQAGNSMLLDPTSYHIQGVRRVTEL